MSFSVFMTTFGIVFLAELGDKTQFTAMALAARYPWKKIFFGIAAAFALLNMGAVLLGKLFFAFLPIFWIKAASALLFLGFGVSSLMKKSDDDEEEAGKAGIRGPIMTAFVMILMAELGDKTQLVTASLAAQYDNYYAVFIGSTLALWSVSLLGIFLGAQLSRFVPLKILHKVAGCLFILFTLIIIVQIM